MNIPKHDEIRIPALELLAKHNELKFFEFEEPLASFFGLSEEQVAEVYASGNGKIFKDRISWALSYMSMAGLVEKPSRGVYCISESGRAMLNTPDKIHEYIASHITARRNESKEKQSAGLAEFSKNNLTPQEELYDSASQLKQAACNELLEMVLSKSPRAFERLVVKLLQKMGYGGEIVNSGQVTPYTNDGGIDGVIKEDVLGLGRIHIQAKKYDRANKIPRDDIQKFVGALAVAKSNKGVFITTSSFSKPAVDYAEGLNGSTTIILIDGDQLASYMYDYGLGVQVEQTVEIKKLDGDFWEQLS